MKLRKYFYLFYFFSFITFAQNQKLSDRAKVSILTCGSGDELYSIYGHTAIRINDLKNNIDLVYNYGYFDFNTPNFYLKFVKGDMQYFGGADYFQSFMAEYITTNRSVFEQELLISKEQKQLLFEKLNQSLNSDQRFYTYKFIDKNCTTMVLDKVNDVFGKQIVTKKMTNNDSYRTILYQYLENHFWENFGINIIFGQKVDRVANTLFLPNELMENLKNTKFNNKPIVKEKVTLNVKTHNLVSFSFWNSILPLLIFLCLLIITNQKVVFAIYFAILGILGIFFSFVGLYSYHEEIWWNYNILLFNPTLLLLIYFIFQENKKWILKIIYLNFGFLSIYMVLIFNKVDFLMLLPIVLTTTILLLKIKKKTLLSSEV